MSLRTLALSFFCHREDHFHFSSLRGPQSGPKQSAVPYGLSLRGPARGRGNLCFWGSSFSFILSLGTRDCHVGTKTVPPRNDRRNGGHHVPEIAASPKIRAPRNDVVGWYRFLAMTLCGDVGSLQ